MRILPVVVVGLAAVLGASGRVAAQPAEFTVEELAKKAREKGALDLVGLTATLELESVRADGEKRTQTLKTSAREIGGRLHTVTRFLSPPGVAGVSVLSIAGRGGGTEEVSIYLPKLRRVRKVARGQRGQSFMDTDFTYADLGDTEVTKSLERLPDGELQGRKTYVLAGKGAEDSPYGRIVVHVDKEQLAPLKVEYADKGGKPLKVFRVLKLRKLDESGRVVPGEAVMENVQKGTRTTLRMVEVQRSTLGDEDFTERALERG